MSRHIRISLPSDKIPEHLRQYFEQPRRCGKCHICVMVEVFREVKRVLRTDGTLFLNYGDCYACAPNGRKAADIECDDRCFRDKPFGTVGGTLKPKDLVMMPHRVALALQAAGWYVRQDIVWAKVNPMPESVTDRPTRAHEYVFLLSKSDRYYYDSDAIRERTGKECSVEEYAAALGSNNGADADRYGAGYRKHSVAISHPAGRNKRSVWSIPSQPFPGAHFATFPEALVEPCILAGTSERGCCPACGAPWERAVETLVPAGHKPRLDEQRFKGGSGGHRSSVRKHTGWQPSCACGDFDPQPCIVLDCFGGSGTVGLVATRLGRRSILIELSPEYVEIAQKRNRQLGLGL